ncbi:Ig-like domain-containing protein [Prevotella sp.]|uniref:Ig-like domain-containing protein n=1 Tax=Prevotella sp. TaxID=59823 RepID=UPI00402A4653
MTKHLRFLIVLLLTLVWSTGWAQTTIDFTKVTWNGGYTEKPYTFKADKSNGSASPTQNTTAKDIRLYAKNKLTVSTTGKKIVKIVFTISTAGKKQWAELTATTGSVVADIANSIATWENVEGATSVTFTVGDKCKYGTAAKTKAGQFCFNSVDIYELSEGDSKTATDITFPTNSFIYTIDNYSSFTGQVATLTSEGTALTGKTITYSKSGDDIFSSFDTTNGTLALNGNPGKATVTATFAGDDTYASSSASYTITVNKLYSTIASFKQDIPSTANAIDKALPFCLKLTDAIVTYVNDKKAYLQDATSGVLIYGDNALDLKVGEKYTGIVNVSACLYNGMAEITAWNAASDIVKEENVDIPVVSVTLEQLNGNDYSKYECVRVKVENATVSTGFTSAKKATIVQGEQKYLIHGEINGLKVTKDDLCDFVGYPIYWKTKSLDEHQLSVWSQDDIIVKPVVLDESADNTIAKKTSADVTLKRPMNVGRWNTFCVPFSIDAKQIASQFGEGTQIAKFALSDNKFIYFETTGIIEAGKAYLVKPTKEAATEGYTFSNVNITALAPTKEKVENDAIDFRGIYNPTDITEDLPTNTFAAGIVGNVVKKAVNGSNMKGFRAFFIISEGVGAQSSYMLKIDGTATSINSINGADVVVNAPVYNLQGQRVDGNNLTPGIYVKAGKKFVVK